MRQIRDFFNLLLGLLRKDNHVRTGDIATMLPPDILQQVLKEADFLSQVHGVDVKSLPDHEEPQTPRPADGSVIEYRQG